MWAAHAGGAEVQPGLGQGEVCDQPFRQVEGWPLAQVPPWSPWPPWPPCPPSDLKQKLPPVGEPSLVYRQPTEAVSQGPFWYTN